MNIVREIDYRLEFTYSQLIPGGMTLKETKETDFIDRPEAERFWRRVDRNTESYKPANEIIGVVRATQDFFEVLSEQE